MRTLTACLLVLAFAAPAQAEVSYNKVVVPEDVKEPMAAVVRMSTGLQADAVCHAWNANQRATFVKQMTAGVRGIHEKLVNSGMGAAKSERILKSLMDEGEKVAQKNFPTCTNLAPDIIVKAAQDAACITPYLAGTDTTCFH